MMAKLHSLTPHWQGFFLHAKPGKNTANSI